MNWEDYDAVLFDLDGVLTPTAEVHMRAWERMFTEFLEGPAREVAGEGADLSPYTDDDYFAHVDGKPRYEGVADFLGSRDIELPQGDPADPPDALTVCGLGNKKNDLFAAVLEEEGISAYEGSVRLLDALAERDIEVAVVSSSRNAPDVLQTAGIADRFDVVVDGALAQQESLAGKPRPDTYAYAAKAVGASNARSVVVEDAVSGVQAGRAGEFGLVVGVDRGAGRQTLLDHGADVVVEDLAELI
ncbi:HAD family hydrolase [Ornithinicoccus halotolerans]|uniref:HAD family hydrolase n=1 Tax=Ornithinicoccus halotolerans TaxID=1748220 RepID=UPI001297B042|nr:HAD-IA family hydrolase [Ornithinicoccus halotolerans]